MCDWSFQVLGYLTMDEGIKDGRAWAWGCPNIPSYYTKMSNQLSLGMPPSGIPAFFQQLSVFDSRLYFYSSHDMCFAWSILYDMCFAFFIFLCFKSSILAGNTYLREPKLCHELLELLSLLHLNFYELWTYSSASLISFWARCA